MPHCLLGIFNVNIPLIYGEGRGAFRRLQEEIVRRSFDPTLLLWNMPEMEIPHQPEQQDQISGIIRAGKILIGLEYPWYTGTISTGLWYTSSFLAPDLSHLSECGDVAAYKDT